MEVHALKILIDELKESGLSGKIVAYVHDNDAKARKLFRDEWPGLKEWVDPGHAMKSFDRSFIHFAGNLKPVQKSLQNFMLMLLRNSEWTVDEKLAAWRNVSNHFRGNHEHCPFNHGETCVWEKMQDPKVSESLDAFLEKTEWILERCTNEWSTQFNESLNRTKSKYANKDVKWWGSYEARMACAVLDRNSPFWKLELHANLGLTPMDPGAILQLTARENQRLMYKAHHSMENRELNGNSKSAYIRRVRSTRQQKEKAPLQQCGYRVNPYLNHWSDRWAPGWDPTLSTQ
jgi:hypothetical protein